MVQARYRCVKLFLGKLVCKTVSGSNAPLILVLGKMPKWGLDSGLLCIIITCPNVSV